MMYSFLMGYAMDDLGWKFFMVNAAYDIVFLAVIYFYWVETARIPLEEVGMKFGDPDPRTLIVGEGSDSMSDVDGDGKATYGEKGGMDAGVKQTF
jgi:hypothetical protein